MIDKLISDIKNYIVYLEEKGIYISIQEDFSEYMLPLVDYFIHRNPKCLLIKSDSEMWEKCIRHHTATKTERNGFAVKKCHAGITEALFGLNSDGNIRVSTDSDIDKNELYTLIKPLCHMVELLKIQMPENETEVTEHELINRAIKFIQRNFGTNITNKQIADFCSCSESSLCHLFKEVTGVSVHKYITGLRISHSKELLGISNQSVASVAAKSGFSDYNYFAACFKKETGLSPSEYRRKNAHTSDKDKAPDKLTAH